MLKLAELRVSHGEQAPEVQQAIARVNELEQMSKEEPNASPELREAKVHLAELRVIDGGQSPDVQEALARVKVLENTNLPQIISIDPSNGATNRIVNT